MIKDMESWFDPRDVRKLKRTEYDRLVDEGFFEDERIELLEGFLVAKEPQGADHASVARRLHRLFLLALDTRAEVGSHSPFAASDDSEPEPDVAVTPRRYTNREHPAQAFLLVEISRGSLRRDRTLKAEIYAQAGVPEYWVVNLQTALVEVRREPANGVYGRMETFGRGDTIQLVAFPDIAIRVDDFLGD